MEQTEKMSSRELQRQKIEDTLHNLSTDDLIYIPARKDMPVNDDTPKKRVCAYCRVSTDDPAQTTSYELQKEHYEEVISKNPDWIYCGIYADEGISATSLKHRDNFNRMIVAAYNGEIDLIITKAVSRFARNVVDCLSIVRFLARLNPPVAVKFETEGINTLDSTSDMILAVMASAAEGESKNKSTSMNWSLENRFKKGKFLTPVLMGYDHDEDGNLIVNPEEAEVVKMMYYMYLAGYTPTEIAETLMELGCETKIGNTKWSSATVRAIMKNERYCGDVLSWKTFTYDFFEHKKRKNDHDRPQVLKKDHHEAIVSRDVFDAAQLKMESEKYTRKGMPLPSLDVVDSGILRGYVSVNRLWSGFSDNDYCEACESVYEQSELSDTNEPGDNISGDFSLDGYRVVRSHFFSTMSKPTLNISQGKVRFNAVCMKKFENVEYVELLLNSVEKCIAVRPCSKDNPNAIRWGKLSGSRWKISSKSCSGFANPLYSIMDWEANCGYKLCGQYISDGDDQMLIFDLMDPEITIYEQIENEISETAAKDLEFIKKEEEEREHLNRILSGKIKALVNGVTKEKKKSKPIYRIEKKTMVPDTWGRKYKEAVLDHIHFTNEIYSGDWEIMKPVTVYKLCGNLSQEIMDKIKTEAVELMEGRPLREAN